MLYRDIFEKNRWNLCYYLIFILRRLIYVRIAFNVVEDSAFQIIGLAFLNLFSLIYLGQFKPFKLRRLNRLELFNEFCIAICTLHLLCFTDWVRSQKMHEIMGWSLIVIIVINIVLNFYFVIRTFLKEVCLLVSKFYNYTKRFWEWLSSLWLCRLVLSLIAKCRKATGVEKKEGERKDRSKGDVLAKGDVDWEHGQNEDWNMVSVLHTAIKHKHMPTPSIGDCLPMNSARFGKKGSLQEPE
jgi:hypothetical protein